MCSRNLIANVPIFQKIKAKPPAPISCPYFLFSMRPQKSPQKQIETETDQYVLGCSFCPLVNHRPTVHPCKSHEFPGMLMYGPFHPKDPALRSDLQHSMGLDAACREMMRPLGSGTCTRNTRRTRVFFLPMSVSPFRSSMSAFRSFRMPAQSMLHRGETGSLSRKDHPQAHKRWSTKFILPTATANCISPWVK